jgi:hypothetical protein
VTPESGLTVGGKGVPLTTSPTPARVTSPTPRPDVDEAVGGKTLDGVGTGRPPRQSHHFVRLPRLPKLSHRPPRVPDWFPGCRSEDDDNDPPEIGHDDSGDARRDESQQGEHRERW